MSTTNWIQETAPMTPEQIEQERAKFEARYQRKPVRLQHDRREWQGTCNVCVKRAGEYESSTVEECWHAWLARASLAPAEAESALLAKALMKAIADDENAPWVEDDDLHDVCVDGRFDAVEVVKRALAALGGDAAMKEPGRG